MEEAQVKFETSNAAGGEFCNLSIWDYRALHAPEIYKWSKASFFSLAATNFGSGQAGLAGLNLRMQ